MAKVLLVTDYSGGLHITPTGNKAYYQSRNNVVKNQQYKFREMSEDEAESFVAKNFGIDPDFKTPKQTAEVIQSKDEEIAALRKQLADMQKSNPEVQEQRDILNTLSTTPTSESPYSEEAAKEIKETKTAGKGK